MDEAGMNRMLTTLLKIREKKKTDFSARTGLFCYVSMFTSTVCPYVVFFPARRSRSPLGTTRRMYFQRSFRSSGDFLPFLFFNELCCIMALAELGSGDLSTKLRRIIK